MLQLYPFSKFLRKYTTIFSLWVRWRRRFSRRKRDGTASKERRTASHASKDGINRRPRFDRLTQRPPTLKLVYMSRLKEAF